MFALDELKPLQLYKTRVVLPSVGKNTVKGSLLFLLTPNLDSSIKTMNSRLLYNKNHKAYYMDRFISITLLSNILRKRMKDDEYALIQQKVQSEVSIINKVAKSVSSYQSNNLFVDLSVYNELFLEDTNYNIPNLITQYQRYLDMMLTDEKFNEYKQKAVIVPVFDWLSENDSLKDDTLYIKANTKSLFQVLFQLLISGSISHDIDFVFVSPKTIFTFNPTKYDGKAIVTDLKTLFKKMVDVQNDVTVATVDEVPDKVSVVNKPVVVTTKSSNTAVKTIVKSAVMKYTGDDDMSDDLDDAIDDAIEKSGIDNVDSDDDIDKVINFNDDIKMKIATEISKSKGTGTSTASTVRDKMIREKQMQRIVNGRTVKEILADETYVPLKPKTYNARTINNEVKNLKFTNFSKTYNDELLERDIMKVIHGLSKAKGMQISVVDLKIEPSSDTFSHKDTYTIIYEDSDRVRHNIKLDIPKFIDDQFLFLNGNLKTINKQFFIQVSKTDVDRVQIATNYQKTFIWLEGNNISPKNQRLKKFLASNRYGKIKSVPGDSTMANKTYKTTLEYMDMAKNLVKVTVGPVTLCYSQKAMVALCEEKKLSYVNDGKLLTVGYDASKNAPIVLNTDSDMIEGIDMSMSDYLTSLIIASGEDIAKDLLSTSVSQKYIHSKVKLMNREIPLILLLAYFEGLEAVLKKANINYSFSTDKPKLTGTDKNNKAIIEFADGYLIYDRYPIENSILLNGLMECPTDMFEYHQFQTKDVYLDIFDSIIGRRNIAFAFDNFYDLFIDGITEEVLKDYNLPTDFVELFCYASSLLADMQYSKSNDISVCRIRANEIVPVYMYKAIADAYNDYSMAKKNGKRDAKMAIRQDEVIKQMLTSKSVEDYSTLNPVLEGEKLSAVSFKGPNGLNMDRAYTMEKRAFDESMLGLVGMSSVPSGSVGVVRQMSVDADVKSARGYMNINKNGRERSFTQLFSAAELLTPLAANHDDSPRTAMMSTQSKHTVSTMSSSPVLVGNGFEKVFAHTISNNFVYKAKEDGEVIDMTDDIVVIKYKSGKTDIINIGNRIAKNGGGGFYISNKMELMDGITKVGDKFKQDDILAANKKFFKQDKFTKDTSYCIGTMIKVAIHGSDFTHEDSAIGTQKLSRDMASEVIMKQDITIGPNSNVYHIAKIGDKVKVGDPLLIFDHSFDEAEMNQFLKAYADDIGNELQAAAKIPIKAKYSGVIEDIAIYVVSDEQLLSPSIQKLVQQYNAKIKKLHNTLDKHKVETFLPDMKPIGKIQPIAGKVKGVAIEEGILIEFYIKYELKLGIGDKVVSYTALKSIMHDIVPEGQEPYAISNPDEEISLIIGPISVDARMTESAKIVLATNKALITLARECQKILNE